ncbi:hypothetical protein Bca52824_017838 [Brassica carinata]|uniref:Uncharacterized protein n=1 Tax=Brassica carinata TaxID=52824 RepID=A0A8X7VNM5_BRACI|nr:hypothetical protein Bca52824_017838 [Brassica carinata]
MDEPPTMPIAQLTKEEQSNKPSDDLSKAFAQLNIPQGKQACSTETDDCPRVYLAGPEAEEETLPSEDEDFEDSTDWESRLPCVLGPQKSRMSLFTQKQQKLLNKSREMDGFLDLSALLKGRLQLLSKKNAAVCDQPGPTGSVGDRTDQDGTPRAVYEGTGAKPKPKKKGGKKTKVKERAAEEHAAEERRSNSSEGDVPVVTGVPSDVAPKITKKKKGKKRPREKDSAGDRDRENVGEDPEEDFPTETAPEGKPKKKTKKKTAETDVVEWEDSSPATPLVRKQQKGATGALGETTAPKRSDPAQRSAKEGSQSEGSLTKKVRVEFPDRVSFSYDEKTPLVPNPRPCAELTRQIRGGTKELPPVDDLFFKDEYIDAASAARWSDGSMNYLVERYDRTLNQTMVQLGASEKLARLRLGAIERMRADQKKAEEKAAEDREILWVKFEELENKLNSERAARKELVHEKARLEQARAALSRERDELQEERDAAVEKLVRERKRLRDSRSQEVTRERARKRFHGSKLHDESNPADPTNLPLEDRTDDRPERTTVDDALTPVEQKDTTEKSIVEEDAGSTREEGANSQTEKAPSRPLAELDEPVNAVGGRTAVPSDEGGSLNSTVDPPAPLAGNTENSSLPVAEDDREPIGPVEEDRVRDSEN